MNETQSKNTEKFTKSHHNHQSTDPGINLKDIILGLMQFTNIAIASFSYFLLVAQTIYIVSGKEPKYINLRHLTIKWLVAIMIS